MTPSVPVIASLLVALVASVPAQAQIYQYKDASGKTVISDRPPPGGPAKARTLATEAPAASTGAEGAQAEKAAAPKSIADRDLEFRKRQQEQKEAADKAQKEAADKAARKEDCARAQRQLQILESGERVSTRDDKGERVFMDDSQRNAEIARNRKFVADACK